MIRLNLTVSGLASLSLIVFPGLYMFAGNSRYLFMAPADLFAFLSLLMMGGLVMFIVLFSVLIASGERNSLALLNVVFFLVVTAAVQYYLLSGNLNRLDAGVGFVTVQQGVRDMIIYGAITVLVYTFRHRIRANIRTLLVSMCLFHALNLATVAPAFSNLIDVPARQGGLNEMSTFSTKENVIHIVLDGFQSVLFQDLIDDDPELVSQFDGFLYYPDALAAAEITELSFGAFLTGQEYLNNTDLTHYLRKSGLVGTSNPEQSNSILGAAARAGYRVDVASPHHMFFKYAGGDEHFFFFVPRPYRTGISPVEVADYQAATICDLILIRSVPALARKWAFNGGRGRLSQLVAPDLELSTGHHVSVRHLSDVIERFALSGEPGTYKLLHMMTPHDPFVTNGDCSVADRKLPWLRKNLRHQARCALLRVGELLGRLDKAGLYDDAIVLIHGDHGISLPLLKLFNRPMGEFNVDGNFPPRIGNSNPLLLLKPPGRRGTIETVDTQVSLSDIPKTLSVLLGLENEFGGIDFLNEQPASRTRWFSSSYPDTKGALKNGRFVRWNRYAVTGPLKSEESWRKSVMADQSATQKRPGKRGTLPLDPLPAPEKITNHATRYYRR